MVGRFEDGHVGFEGMQDQDVVSVQRVLRLNLGMDQAGTKAKGEQSDET